MVHESTDLLAILRLQAQAGSADLERDRFVITSLAKVQAQFRPHKDDLPYSDVIVVAQTSGPGSCYCYCEDPVLPGSILGEDARYVQTGSRCIDIAVLDAAYSSLLPTPDIYCRLEGSSYQKAEARASLMLSEVQRLIPEANLSRPRITMVGAVGSILASLASSTREVFATDLDPTLIGKKLGGVLVEDGHSMTLERISHSDIALVTGMTLATDTLGDILNTAKLHGVRIIMYAETGGNFASEFLGWGVDGVVSEEYPFYMFPGITTLRVFRAKPSMC